MNPVIKIINQAIIIINKLINHIDRKTAETIKHSFYFLVFILIIAGAIIGYNNGKRAAKMYGKPLNESTNSIFDVKIKAESGTGRFQSMLDTELMEEQKEMQLRKNELPANEKQLKPEFDQNIIESDKTEKNSAGHIESSGLAEIERTDERMKKADVLELKKEKTQTGKNNNYKSVKPIDNDFNIIEK